jgi:hypothetical protein
MEYRNQSAPRKMCDVYLKGVSPTVIKRNVFPQIALSSTLASVSCIFIKLFHLTSLCHSLLATETQEKYKGEHAAVRGKEPPFRCLQGNYFPHSVNITER